MADNRRRTLLTTLGIIIGVAAVVIIVSIGAAAQNLILAQVKSVGPDLVGILPGKSESNGPPASVMGIAITTLTADDGLALEDKHNATNVLAAVAYSRSTATVSWQGTQITGDLSGVTANYLDVEGGEVASGRWFTDVEDRGVARVAVMGSQAAADLFGNNDPLNRHIKVGNQDFEVIGVMAERGQVMLQDYDSYIFLPLTTVQKLIAGVHHVSMIRAKVDSESNVPPAINDITLTLRERHGIQDSSGASDDFTVRSVSQALDVLGSITNALRYFLAAMAALSLVVGGIGIMNIMLIRVAQRTKEIGLRKAVGASNSDIRWQFLVESINITLIGGLAGVLIGCLVSWLIAVVAQSLGYDWVFSVSWLAIALAVGVSMAIGLLFGLYPARKAARLSPIEALSYE